MNRIIGIIGAMDVEINKLLDSFDGQAKSVEMYGSAFYCGQIRGKNAVVVKSGIGKVNAAFVSTLLRERFNVTEIVMTGVAGGIGLNSMTAVVPSSFIQHDVYMGDASCGYLDVVNTVVIEADKELSRIIRGTDGVDAVLATGEQFIDSDGQIETILSKFPSVKAVDMECGAVAQVCRRMGVPFAAVKIISDNGSVEDFFKFLNAAAEKSVSLVLRIF